jgi:flavin reductase (DIM6/NTAB) family NADH-FMN oxidoreductase RutF
MKKAIGAQRLAYPLPVFIVGSYDSKKMPNIMAASWGGICCSKPPLITISIQPVRYSFDCIMENKAFTVNIPSSEYVAEADFTGVFSGKDGNKFEKTGLTAVDSKIVNAPYVEEFPVNILCDLFKTVELGSHTQFIGEIKDILVNDDILNSDNKPALNLVDTFTYDNANREYYKIGDKISNAYLNHNKREKK